MKSKWLAVSFLVAMILVGVSVLTIPPPRAHAQAIGYVATGQQNVTATATVISGISYGTVCIKALHTNNIGVYIGGPAVTTSTGMELWPGDIPYYCAEVNSSPFYVIASTTGASVSWIQTR